MDGALDADKLRRAIAEAAGYGYKALHVSGGEPLLYPKLWSLLEEARQHGMGVTLATNGTMLAESRIDALKPLVDLVIVSVDSAPGSFRPIRPLKDSRERIEAGLRALRTAGVPFEVSATLTRESGASLMWIAEFASDQGAAGLRVHPLERTGRGHSLADLTPNEEETAVAGLMIQFLQRYYQDQLPIRFDWFQRGRAAGLADEWRTGNHVLPSPLVIEADGTAVPFRYGFPRRFALGSVCDDSLACLLQVWEKRRGLELRKIACAVLDRVAGEWPFPFVDLPALLIEAAGEPPQARLIREAAVSESPPPRRLSPGTGPRDAVSRRLSRKVNWQLDVEHDAFAGPAVGSPQRGNEVTP